MEADAAPDPRAAEEGGTTGGPPKTGSRSREWPEEHQGRAHANTVGGGGYRHLPLATTSPPPWAFLGPAAAAGRLLCPLRGPGESCEFERPICGLPCAGFLPSGFQSPVCWCCCCWLLLLLLSIEVVGSVVGGVASDEAIFLFLGRGNDGYYANWSDETTVRVFDVI